MEVTMNQILMTIMAAGVVLGGADRLLGNKFGYGDKFEEGFRLLGSTALSMAGMICLAPVLADVLGRIVVPLYRMIGADPAMFGSILAIDMGGYQLATELAADSRIGSYAGIVAAAIFGWPTAYESSSRSAWCWPRWNLSAAFISCPAWLRSKMPWVLSPPSVLSCLEACRLRNCCADF